MAGLDGYLGTASEGIGQGLAFVLPDSNTERYAMQLSQQHAAEMRAQALRQQQLQQQQEIEYQKSIAAQKLPEYWARVGQNINDNYNKWLKDASNYHALTGKDPFKNPNYVERYNNEVLLPARQSKELEVAYNNGLSKVAADSDNKFTEQSKQSFNQWVQDVDKNPLTALGKPVPQLEGTPSTIQDAFKQIKPVYIQKDDGTWDVTRPNTSAMMEQAYQIVNDPRYNNAKRVRYGIDPDLGDIGSVYNKDGKRVWYTNPVATGHIADEILSKPTIPHNADVLTKLGISPDQPYAKERLQEAITKQNAGYGKLITDAGRYGSSLVSAKTSYTPDKFYEHEAWLRAHPAKTGKPPVEDTVILGNQGSSVPVVKDWASGQPRTDEKGNIVKAGSEAETGASLFSSNFDNQRVTVTPGHVIDLKNGHAIKNTESFNMDLGTIKMVPVFKGLDDKDSRNGAELSLRQLKEIVAGKSTIKAKDGQTISLANIEFQPYAYGQRPLKKDGKVSYEGIAVPYDAIRGNSKIPTKNFDNTVTQFKELLASPEFKSLSAQQRVEFLQKTFNIQE